MSLLRRLAPPLRGLLKPAGNADVRFLGLCLLAAIVVLGLAFGAEGTRSTLTAVLEGLLGAILGGFAGAYLGKSEADKATGGLTAQVQELRDRQIRLEGRVQ